MNIKEIDKQYVAGTYARFPLLVAGGKGSVVWDENGKKYIDLGTGIAVNIFGVADDAWIAAVTKQLGTLQHMSNLYFTEPTALLAQMLCERTGMKKVFFGNSGAEANECAIKAARKYASDKYGSERNVIVSLVNSFHGRTITTLAATGQDEFHNSFLPLTGGFIHTPPNDVEALKTLVNDNPNIAAFMIESVQGEGGIMPLDPAFVTAMAELAEEKDILLICDEVQCGNGRTGKLYAYMNYDLNPDIVSTAKGLGGGLPLGATLLGEKVEDVLGPGTHGSTFGGNPVCCAGALSILSRIDDALMAEVNAKSEYIISELSGAPGVKSVSGLGLMLGVETEKPAGDVISACMEKGVLVIKAKNKVRLLPALNIPMELLSEAVAVIKEVCAE
ncbi:MAG: acetylornithine/succinylornithine family transaminase [Clostridia bacterium]|nr:acetylornithine/succinylornithine family transaminase [Clostridia bacterium]